MVKNREAYTALIDEWEYCYCVTCEKIRYKSDLEATGKGIRCSECRKYALEAPTWIFCPQAMFAAATKCPRAGKGIKKGKYGIECLHRCSYRQRYS